jgi:hypothetical protein
MNKRFGPALFISAVLALVIALVFLQDWISNRPAADAHVQGGQVVSRDMIVIASVIRRPLLTIRVDGTSDIVKSVLLINSSGQVPNQVSFYSPPIDPNDVQLLEETSSLIAALCMAALSMLCALLLLPIPRRPQKQT